MPTVTSAGPAASVESPARRLRGRRARRQDEGGRGDHGAQEQLLRNPHVSAFHQWKIAVPES